MKNNSQRTFSFALTKGGTPRKEAGETVPYGKSVQSGSRGKSGTKHNFVNNHEMLNEEMSLTDYWR